MHVISFHCGRSAKVLRLLIFLSYVFTSPCNSMVPSTCRLFCFSAICPIAPSFSLPWHASPHLCGFLSHFKVHPHTRKLGSTYEKAHTFFLVFLILSHFIYNHFHIHSFFSEYFHDFILELNSIVYICHIFFTHLFCNGHQGWFYSPAIVSNAAITKDVQHFV